MTGIASGATLVSAGGAGACAVVDGSVQCWGVSVALGDGQAIYDGPTPVKVLGLTGVTSVSVGYFSACAVAHGDVACWGANLAGQLGNDGRVDSLVPSPVAGFP